jgi:hypothetical protein
MAKCSALAQTFMGDVFSDLPPVHNFTTAEAAHYASGPRTPYQLWLRRPPPSWQASAEQRAAAADKAMGRAALRLRERHAMLGDTSEGDLAVRSLRFDISMQSQGMV